MIITGLFAGLMIGVAGASGAAIMVSLLYILLNFSIHESIGTSLMANAIASTVVAFVYYRNRNIEFSPCLWLALGSIPGTQLGAIVANKTPETSLGGFVGVVLIIMGFFLWKRGLKREKILEKIGVILRVKDERLKKTISIGIGLWVGLMSGLFGASGGVWFLAILFLLFGLPLHKSVGGAAFLMMLTAFSATMAHAGYGEVNLSAGLLVGIGAAVSGNLSAKFANKSTEEVLIKSVAVLLITLGIFMVAINLV